MTFKVKDTNLKIVGFFGQSGAGKTTIIKSVAEKSGGRKVIRNTGVIRYLFSKNPNAYKSPQDFIAQRDSIMAEANPGSQIATMQERYIKSQLQLMNDFSTEVFNSARADYSVPSVMLFDRCPLDFHALTECGMNHLISVFGGKVNRNHAYFLEREKETAVYNTKHFFDAIFVVKPWADGSINGLSDGVRDQYLNPFYTGNNWYSKLEGIDVGPTKIFFIDENITSLEARARFVESKLKEI